MEGQSFDELRATLRRVGREIGRRTTASRVDDAYTLWSPTADALGELMRLELIEHRSVPSKRTAVDAHRETIYRLTNAGRAIIEEVQGDESKFRGAVTPVLVRQHPHLSSLCELLEEGPLLIPEYTEEDLKNFRQSGPSWTAALGADAAKRIREGMRTAVVADERAVSHVRDWIARRFPAESSPTPRDILDTVLDALVVVALESRGLRFDATTFNILVSWGRQLFIMNESRYVHNADGRSVWSTADICDDGGTLNVVRHKLKDVEVEVPRVLSEVYRDIASSRATSLGGNGVQFPYLQIYEVRATAAFRLRVNDPIVERIIADLADGTRSAGLRVELALGTGRQASSETPFRLGSRRFSVILIKPEGSQP